MQKLRLTILFSFCILTAMAQHKTTLRIKSLPAFHPSGSNIYLAGSFNGWNPQDKNFMFRRDSAGIYFIELQLADGSYEYKLTRGGWDKA
ncbi:MAG TPA: glycogen-binding domain-containing protein, partial [Chitinophagaceae bacterium]|nr:glycogen-binding domain-containing protein [Chitinophagaceae bacterium]